MKNYWHLSKLHAKSVNPSLNHVFQCFIFKTNNTLSSVGLHLGTRWYYGDFLIFDTRNRNIYPPNDRVQLAEDTSLIVNDVQAGDTGDYYCEVIFSNAPAIRQEHSIEVQCMCPFNLQFRRPFESQITYFQSLPRSPRIPVAIYD